MRTPLIFFSVFTWLSVCALGAPPKFDRVLVLHGGGFQTAKFLGVLDGLKEAGWVPDLVITTCGASLAGVLMNGMNDPKDRIQFLKSKTFHDEILRIKMRKPVSTGLSLVASLLNFKTRGATETPTAPILNVFGKNTLLDVPVDSTMELASRKFSKEGIRILMVGARMHYGPEDVGKKDLDGSTKFYTEVYLTDEDLAPRLEKMKSPIATMYPKSAVAEATEVKTDLPLGTSARISISDLMYMEPVKLKDAYYAGGFVNLFPLELGVELGKEVLMIGGGDFDEMEQLVIQNTLGYDGNARRAYLTKWSRVAARKNQVRWIELPDQDKMYAAHGFNPKLEKTDNPFEPWLKMTVPARLEDYATKVQAQYDWGKEKAVAAMKEKK